ncbi:hypothetical protein SAMN02910456_02194 [Ruminococcaceae bacterium YRB3002]|nr:hypothetical protein SAMN02910456_02194 [Ruminococcaceae bacterium YRB3002]
MDKSIIESMKGKSREERMEFFEKNKAEILALSGEDLENVNGGAGADDGNPNSEGFWGGNYYTSWGYMCQGIVKC